MKRAGWVLAALLAFLPLSCLPTPMPKRLAVQPLARAACVDRVLSSKASPDGQRVVELAFFHCALASEPSMVRVQHTGWLGALEGFEPVARYPRPQDVSAESLEPRWLPDGTPVLSNAVQPEPARRWLFQPVRVVTAGAGAFGEPPRGLEPMMLAWLAAWPLATSLLHALGVRIRRRASDH